MGSIVLPYSFTTAKVTSSMFVLFVDDLAKKKAEIQQLKAELSRVNLQQRGAGQPAVQQQAAFQSNQLLGQLSAIKQPLPHQKQQLQQGGGQLQRGGGQLPQGGGQRPQGGGQQQQGGGQQQQGGGQLLQGGGQLPQAGGQLPQAGVQQQQGGKQQQQGGGQQQQGGGQLLQGGGQQQQGGGQQQQGGGQQQQGGGQLLQGGGQLPQGGGQQQQGGGQLPQGNGQYQQKQNDNDNMLINKMPGGDSARALGNDNAAAPANNDVVRGAVDSAIDSQVTNSKGKSKQGGVGMFVEPTKGSQILDKIIKNSRNGVEGAVKGKSGDEVVVGDKPVVDTVRRNVIADIDNIPGRTYLQPY